MIISGYTTREATTIAFFKTKFGKEFSVEEARRITDSLTEVFTLLGKWAIEQKVFETTNEENSGDCND